MKKKSYMLSLGNKIKQAREQAGLTQEYLAELIGTSRAAITRYELGEIEPKLKNLMAIAEHLHVSVDYLLGIESSGSGGPGDTRVSAVTGVAGGTAGSAVTGVTGGTGGHAVTGVAGGTAGSAGMAGKLVLSEEAVKALRVLVRELEGMYEN